MSAPICEDCVSGVIHSGTPKGRSSTIHGLNTYIAEPPDGRAPKGLIVVITDVFGWELTNVRVLADTYAEKGSFLVYVPDYLKGYAVDPKVMLLLDKLKQSTGILGFFSKVPVAIQVFVGIVPFLLHSGDSTVLPTINAFLRSCRENEGKALKIGAAGFCYGGRLAVLLTHKDERTSAADGKALIDVVFVGHPSLAKIPGDFEKVKLPLSIAIGSEDSWVPFKQVEEIRRALDKKAEVEHEVVVYQGAKHGSVGLGFTVRGDPGDEEAVKQGIEAEDQAVAWFTRFLG